MDIGAKINQLRKKNGLTQEELADRCELSKGFISQVERRITSPSIATLIDILECLGTNLKDFFNETSQEKIVFSKQDIFEKEDKLYYPLALNVQPTLITNAKQCQVLKLLKSSTFCTTMDMHFSAL